MNLRDIHKAVIIGAGFVGSTTAYTLMLSGLFSELVIIDINETKAKGEVMDLNHGIPFAKPVKIYQGTYADCKNADLIIISAGANQKEGETRIDLVNKNTVIFKSIISQVVKYTNPEDSIILVVTNPVDILTYVTWKLSDFPSNRVIGSGTVLDTARFRYLIGEHVGVDPRNVHGYILGEHGDSELAAWSLTNIAGMTMNDYCKSCGGCKDSLNMAKIFEDVKNAAYEIIKAKGATYYAVALAVQRISEAIMRDEHSILTVSSVMDGQYGLKDVSISVPTLVDRQGISKVIEVQLSPQEMELLNKSADTLKSVIKQLKL
ncbi:MAG: L-lactate dehydrogenase [Clostridiaceae bacterium]|nr:L-lactate dehydrogenase [Clostridiaceae bacterium]